MKDEYGDEMGLYGRVEAPEDVDPAKIAAVQQDGLDGLMDKQIKQILDSSAIIDDIDSEIKRITEKEKDEVNKKKNLKAMDRPK